MPKSSSVSSSLVNKINQIISIPFDASQTASTNSAEYTSTANNLHNNYYFLRSQLGQAPNINVNSSASNTNIHEAAKSAPSTSKYTSSYYDSANNRSYTSAQERAAIKLNNYLANNQCYYDIGTQNSAKNTTLTNNYLNYSSAYLEPELKSQLLSAQQQTMQPSSVLVQTPSYYNSRSKSVSLFSFIISFTFY